VAGRSLDSRNAAAPAEGRTRVLWIWTISLFLVVAIGLVFGQTLWHSFLGFDDAKFVYDNPHVTAGFTLSGLRWAMTDGPYGEWYPLTSLSHMFDCQLYGLNPAGHYLTNLLLHAAASVMLFLVLLRMTGALWPSAWVAAVFAIHPLHVESVVWLAERRDVLSGLFFMLTVGAYALYVERPSLARYAAVAVLFALGLMAKSILVTVPFLLLLLDFWPLERFRQAGPRAASGSRLGRLPVFWRLVGEKIPLVALATVSCLIELSTHASVPPIDPGGRFSFGPRLANALVSYVAYIGQSFYPVDMAPFYPYPARPLPTAEVAGALVLLLAITAVALISWRRRPYLLVGWLWYLGMLAPVIGLVHVGFHARADRYTYLSQIGLSIALAWCGWSAYQSRSSHQKNWRGGWILGTASGVALLVLSAIAWHQTTYWRNGEALWMRTAACTSGNAMAHLSLADIYHKRGKADKELVHLQAALQAGSINPPELAATHVLLADALTRRAKVDEGLTHYKLAISILPSDSSYRHAFGVALAQAGKMDQAMVAWREAIRLRPDFLPMRFELADVLLATGDVAGAVDEYRAAVNLAPDSAEAQAKLAEGLLVQGGVHEALISLQRAAQLDSKNAAIQLRLAQVLIDRGSSLDAISILKQAVQQHPDDVPLLWQSAWILATSPDSQIRDGAQAVNLANQAMRRFDGREPRVLDALAAALAETKQFPAAIDAADQAALIALAQNQETLSNAIAQRRRLYRQGLPFRQPRPSQSTDDASPAGEAPPQVPW
jgi:protein O-mannosyl-transferase